MTSVHTSRKSGEVPVSDLTPLLRPYRSGWVALSPDERRVVGAGETLRDARERAMNGGTRNAVFVKIIPPDQGYIPVFL